MVGISIVYSASLFFSPWCCNSCWRIRDNGFATPILLRGWLICVSRSNPPLHKQLHVLCNLLAMVLEWNCIFIENWLTDTLQHDKLFHSYWLNLPHVKGWKNILKLVSFSLFEGKFVQSNIISNWVIWTLCKFFRLLFNSAVIV